MDIFSSKVSYATVHEILSRVSSLSAFNAVVGCTALFAFVKLLRMSRSRVRTTKLMGPPNPSLVYGVGKLLMEAEDPSTIFDTWAHKYGTVYEVPSMLGERMIVLYDTKAIAHVHAKMSWTYVHSDTARKMREKFGQSIFASDGETHKRQRRALAPAFTNAAIREVTPIFFDGAHKILGAWNALVQSNGAESTTIDVQRWMNYMSLDTIGLAGFSYDFGTLAGKRAPTAEMLGQLTSPTVTSKFHIGLELLSLMFPFLQWLPSPRRTVLINLRSEIADISDGLFTRMKRDGEMGAMGGKEDKSVIGTLVKGGRNESTFHLSKEEVIGQIKVLLLAGYETTSITMTWALIELARHPDVQTKLRNEILEHGSDLSYEQLANSLPYLDAVVNEVLRLYAAIRTLTRVAREDDVMPLSEPVRTKSGELVEYLSIAKGTVINLPLFSFNRAVHIWGEDAKVFRPDRWLEDQDGQDGIPAKAKEVQGYRCLVSFSDGTKMCLGKQFALIEIKVVLVVLLANFVLELPGGKETKIETVFGFNPRPRVVGETGCRVPLRVKPYMG